MNGSGLQYLNGHGRRLRDARHIKRIDSLAIPPAWTDVWICRQPNGHLQATGRDDRGRKQYIYHEQWREISNEAKFLRLKPCVQFLPVLRRHISNDLRGKDLSRTRVLAGSGRVVGPDFDSRRQRRIRSREQFVWPGNASHASRDLRGRPASCVSEANPDCTARRLSKTSGSFDCSSS